MAVSPISSKSPHACGSTGARAEPAPLHSFVPKPSKPSGTLWQKIKNLFCKESKKIKFLQSLAIRPVIEWKEHRADLAEILAASKPYSKEWHLVRQLLKKAGPDDLKAIFFAAFDHTFQSNGQDFIRMGKVLDTPMLQSFAGSEDMAQEIAEMAECLPPPKDQVKNKSGNGLMKTLNVVIRFFPNFMDTVLKAFNLIDAGKEPETIWDFAAMMEIYYKIFMVPHAVFMGVGAIISASWKLYAITGCVILAAVIGICLYLKFRPCPNKLPRARNLTEEANLGKLEPVVGREKEIQQVGTYLGKKKDGILTNLLLVGDPGVGKTELVKGVAQKYKEKTIFALSAPELAGGYTPVADKLRMIFLDIKGHEDKVVFFIDELGEAIKKNPSVNLSGYLKPLLGPDGVQVIAAVTSEEYKEQILPDNALAERFTTVEVKPTTKEQTLSILQKRMENKGATVRFQPKIAEEVYQKTEGMLQPRNAVKLLDLAINRVRAFDIEKYVSEELQDARKQLLQKQKAYQAALEDHQPEKSQLFKEIKSLKGDMQVLKSKSTSTRLGARRVQRLMMEQQKLIQRRNSLSRTKPQDKTLPYLHWVLLPWMEQKIESEISHFKDIPMQVDSSLIDEIYKDWKVPATEATEGAEV